MQGRLGVRLQEHTVYRSLHGGLIMLIPVLLTGAFSLALQNLPIPAYLSFINSFQNGFLFSLLNCVFTATFSLLSVYATLFVGLSYSREKGSGKVQVGSVATSFVVFFILSGVASSSFTMDAFGPKGMFVALFSSLCGSSVYWRFLKMCNKEAHVYADGMDYQLERTLKCLKPRLLKK